MGVASSIGRGLKCTNATAVIGDWDCDGAQPASGACDGHCPAGLAESRDAPTMERRLGRLL